MENVFTARRMDELCRVGVELLAAREALAAYTEIARAAARDASEAGCSERSIAAAFDVDRGTVRRWLGKQ
jgi:DNA-directed RNA polymerase specialized sigma24 family protein